MLAPSIVTPDIRPEDRVFFAGRTGSGKSVLAKSLLPGFRAFAVLDPKHTFKMPGVPILPHFDKAQARQIIRVPMYDRKRDKKRTAEQDRWRDVIDDIWKAGNRIMYVDELTLITPQRPMLPELGKAIRTGRERGLGVWTGAQRPKEVPSEVFTEAEHLFIFELNWMQDRAKIVSFTQDRFWRLSKGLGGHGFVYHNVRENKTVRMAPIAIRG